MKIETKNGYITIRTPNYPEAMRLLGNGNLAENNAYECMAFIAEQAEKHIENINIKGIKSYKELLSDPKYSEEINLIVTEITKCLESFSVIKKNV
jgi:hydroxymethylpyrimidine/phosphomethylpyrimidine kinase